MWINVNHRPGFAGLYNLSRCRSLQWGWDEEAIGRDRAQLGILWDDGHTIIFEGKLETTARLYQSILAEMAEGQTLINTQILLERIGDETYGTDKP